MQGQGDADRSMDTSRYSHSRKRPRILGDFDDMDIEMDDPPAKDQGDVDFDDDFGESQDAEEASTNQVDGMMG